MNGTLLLVLFPHPTCSSFARRFFHDMSASLMELRPRPKYHITLWMGTTDSVDEQGSIAV
jgi:hypothetical protein